MTIADEYRAIDWEHGACHGLPTQLFYPRREDPPDTSSLGAAICQSCEIKSACLEWAMKHEKFGTWGGLSERQRRLMRRAEHRRITSPENRTARNDRVRRT